MTRKSTVRRGAGRLALALSALMVVALALTATGTAADDTNVLIVYRAYQPGESTVVAGQTVLWRNSGLGPHTVTSDTGLFDSGKINAGETFTYTFTTPGSYSYSCTIHPTMHGKVAVLPAGSSPPGPPPAVHVSLSKTSGRRGRVTVVHVQVARPGAKLALQSQSPAGSWTTIARAQLGAGGRAKFTISASLHRKLRVVVRGPGAEPPVFSTAQRA